MYPGFGDLNPGPICGRNRCGQSTHPPTPSRIAALIQEVVKKVHLGIGSKDLSRYSAHLLQVWACVLLDEAGKSPN